MICHEWNTAVHASEFEGRPGRRALTAAELQRFFDHADDQVDRVAGSGRKGTLAAFRDAALFKVVYAWGLRRRETVMLDLADLHRNAQAPQFGSYGALHVRYGKASRGSPPKRRTVLSVHDWAVDALRQYVEEVRDGFEPGASSGAVGDGAPQPGVGPPGQRAVRELSRGGRVAGASLICTRCGIRM